MTNGCRAVVVLAFAWAFAASAAAQEARPPVLGPLPIASGVRVRLTPFGSQPITGYLAGRGPRTLTISVPTDNPLAPMQPVEFALDSVKRLDLSLGKKNHVWLGVLVGALVIGATGFSDEVDPSHCDASSDAFCSRAEAVAVSALAGALVGGTVGFFVKTERWVPVAADALAVPSGGPSDGARAPEPRGVSAGISLRF